MQYFATATNSIHQAIHMTAEDALTRRCRTTRESGWIFVRKCGLYLPCVDLRERNAMPRLDTAAVCMVHLDILAQQQGSKPLSILPWNRIGG